MGFVGISKVAGRRRRLHQQRSYWISRLVLAMVLMGMGMGSGVGMPAPAIAQLPFFRLLQPPPDEFPPSPLELTEADPLLPTFPMERSLTVAEKNQLRPALDQLRAEGAQALQTGNTVQALDRWYRELRLRKFLGLQGEVAALGEVGAIVAQQNQTEAVRVLTERLRAIGRGEDAAVPTREDTPFAELTAVAELETSLLEPLGVAYQAVRAPRLALVVYEELLARDRKTGNLDQIQPRLETLGELHLSWFDYGPAAVYYEELLTLESQRLRDGAIAPLPQEPGPLTVPTERELPPEIPPPYRKTVAYLQQLANIYQRANLPEKAIATQQRLITTYGRLGLVRPIPALQVVVGDHYARVGNGAAARSLYLRASALGQKIQQFGVARQALMQLTHLYQHNPGLRPSDDAVIQTALAELEVARLAGDAYGMMDAYDRLGKWLRSQGQLKQARVAFEQGAILAEQINHRQIYFQRQLQTLGN